MFSYAEARRGCLEAVRLAQYLARVTGGEHLVTHYRRKYRRGTVEGFLVEDASAAGRRRVVYRVTAGAVVPTGDAPPPETL